MFIKSYGVSKTISEYFLLLDMVIVFKSSVNVSYFKTSWINPKRHSMDRFKHSVETHTKYENI